MDTASTAGAKLILYDIDTAPGGLGGITNPYPGVPTPTIWSAEGSEETFPDRLSPDDLERAGQQRLARQVRSARDAGIEAFGWLPSKKGADALAEYAEQQGADLIMLPQSLDDPSLIERLRKETAKEAIKQTNVPIALVDEEGNVEYPQHDAQVMGSAESKRAAREDLRGRG